MNGGHFSKQQAEVQGGQTLLDRLRAKRAGNPNPDFSHLDDMDALWERLSARGAADLAAFQAAHPELADVDEPAPEIKRARKPRQRQRLPNVATIINRLRTSGERGTVRVELPNGIVVTSSVPSDTDAMPDDGDAAEKLWLERVAKHAH